MSSIEILLIIAGVLVLLFTSLHTLGVVLIIAGAVLLVLELFFALFVFGKVTKGMKDFDSHFKNRF